VFVSANVLNVDFCAISTNEGAISNVSVGRLISVAVNTEFVVGVPLQ